ncbi:unnamed protein product [Protopolystoma xenopodis]|uniref:Uncharacterized protein n=1 Tax=Protopolystoma xenopodis TaxID=117903 RepID=A0A3S5CQ69_9PLAT|nr:unnamed protein product [Protopolystoma xenopodis]
MPIHLASKLDCAYKLAKGCVLATIPKPTSNRIAYDSLLQAMARSGHVPLGSSPLQAATATSISPGFYASPAAAVLAAAQAAATHAAYYGSNPAVQTTNQVPSSGQQGQPISHSATPGI